MSLIGGSSSRQTTNLQEYNFANYNSGEAGAGGSPNFNLAGLNLSGGKGGKGAAGGDASIQINTSDYGAIEAGRSLAQSALDSGGQTFERALSFASQTSRDTMDALRATTDTVVSKSLGIAQANQTPEGSQLLDAVKQIAIGVAVTVVVAMLVKGSKS